MCTDDFERLLRRYFPFNIMLRVHVVHGFMCLFLVFMELKLRAEHLLSGGFYFGASIVAVCLLMCLISIVRTGKPYVILRAFAKGKYGVLERHEFEENVTLFMLRIIRTAFLIGLSFFSFACFFAYWIISLEEGVFGGLVIFNSVMFLSTSLLYLLGGGAKVMREMRGVYKLILSPLVVEAYNQKQEREYITGEIKKPGVG